MDDIKRSSDPEESGNVIVHFSRDSLTAAVHDNISCPPEHTEYSDDNASTTVTTSTTRNYGKLVFNFSSFLHSDSHLPRFEMLKSTMENAIVYLMTAISRILSSQLPTTQSYNSIHIT